MTENQAQLAGWLSDESDRPAAEGLSTIALESPSSLLVFNNSDFASPWINASWPASFLSVQKACEATAPLEDLIVLQPADAPLDGEVVQRFAASIESRDHEFAADFEIVGEQASAQPGEFMTIWRLAD